MALNRRFIFTRMTLAAALAFSFSAHAADSWPSKPISLVVPFAAGGTTDILAREIGQKLNQTLNQPFIVDNRPGAGGTLGASFVSKAPADGYTFLMATVAHTMAPGIYKTLPYDFSKDLVPVGLVALTPNVLLVNPSIPVKTVAELVNYIKANPGKVNFGSAGTGSTEHLSGEMFRAMTKSDISHIP
jgi:tripartite-type tricarboxylate transporter receptor subunit TctC